MASEIWKWRVKFLVSELILKTLYRPAWNKSHDFRETFHDYRGIHYSPKTMTDDPQNNNSVMIFMLHMSYPRKYWIFLSHYQSVLEDNSKPFKLISLRGQWKSQKWQRPHPGKLVNTLYRNFFMAIVIVMFGVHLNLPPSVLCWPSTDLRAGMVS